MYQTRGWHFNLLKFNIKDQSKNKKIEVPFRLPLFF